MQKLEKLSAKPEFDHPLSFVTFNNDGSKNFWVTERSGNHHTDTETGKRYALELLDHLEDIREPVIFKSICQAVTAAGVFDGVEQGFFLTLGFRLFN